VERGGDFSAIFESCLASPGDFIWLFFTAVSKQQLKLLSAKVPYPQYKPVKIFKKMAERKNHARFFLSAF